MMNINEEFKLKNRGNRMEILAQIFGVIGLIIMAIGMQFRRKKNMLLAQIATNTCYRIQYFLLGAFTGAFTFIVNNLR